MTLDFSKLQESLGNVFKTGKEKEAFDHAQRLKKEQTQLKCRIEKLAAAIYAATHSDNTEAYLLAEKLLCHRVFPDETMPDGYMRWARYTEDTIKILDG